MNSLISGALVCLALFALVFIGKTIHAASAADADPNTLPTPSVSSVPQLSPIVVTATRSDIPLKQAPTTITILTQEDIAESGALAVDDLLRQIPGFNTFRRSSSLVTAPAQDPEAQGVTLRGIGLGGASRALVLLDGIPINDAFGDWLYWGELPLDNIERIEVVRGGNSTLWGNFALGGVINIITKEPTEQSVSGSALGGNRGTTNEMLSYTDVFGPLRVGLSGNFFHTDGWNIITPSQRGPIDRDSGSEHKTFNGRLEYDPLPQLSLFLRGAYYDESRDTGTPLRIGYTGRGFITGGGRLHTNDGSDWQVNVFTHLSRFREHFSRVSEDRTSESPSQHQVVPSSDVDGAFTWTRLFLTDHHLVAGMDFRLIEGKSRDTFFSSSAAVTDRRVSKGKQQFFGFFLQDVYTPIERLHIALGVRLDYLRNFSGRVTDMPTGLSPEQVSRFPDRSSTAISPRLSFRDRDLEGKRLTQVPWYEGTVGIRYHHPSQLTALVRGRFERKKYEDAANHDTLGGYYVIDPTFSYPRPSRWLLPHVRAGRIFLSMQNLLDRTYVVDRGGGIFKIGTPLLVSGGLQLRF